MIYLLTDSHLGTSRKAHTTRDSSHRLQEAIFCSTTQVVMDYFDTRSGDDDLLVHLGDLFNSACNNESTLLRGYNVARQCHLMLAGNHDSLNRTGTLTSLQAIDQMLGKESPIVIQEDFSKPHIHAKVDEKTHTVMTAVPHHPTQALFLEALKEAVALAHTMPKYKHILLLHCSYNSPWTDGQGADNNLPAETASELLQEFDYVLLGHEHQPAEHHGGRLIILGNPHPTSFSDMSSKYYWTWDGEKMKSHRIWDESAGRRQVIYDPHDIDALDTMDWTHTQFVEVTGTAGADSGPDIARFINRIWKQSDQLLMVRNNVGINDHLASMDQISEAPSLVDLGERIRTDLKKSDLLPVYEELHKELNL